MPVTVKFDPTSNSQQAQIIQDATPHNDGVMSKAQAALLAAGGAVGPTGPTGPSGPSGPAGPAGASIVHLPFQLTLAMLQAAGAVQSASFPLSGALPANARFMSLIIGETNFTPIDDPTHDRARITFQGVNLSATQIAAQMLGDANDSPLVPQALGIDAVGVGGGPGGLLTSLSGMVPLLFVSMDTVNLNTLTAGAFSVDLYYMILP